MTATPPRRVRQASLEDVLQRALRDAPAPPAPSAPAAPPTPPPAEADAPDFFVHTLDGRTFRRAPPGP